MIHQKLNMIAIGFLIGVQLFMLQWILELPPQKPLAVVDVQALVSVEAQKALALYPKNQLPPEKLHEIAMHLKKRVEAFAEAQKITLLAQGAVWGGTLPDYTESVMEWLKKEEVINAD